MHPAMAASALASLNLERTERADEPIYDPGLYAVDVSPDWFVVFADGSEDMRRLSEADAASLSSTGDVLFFYCDDTPMCTRMARYSRGEVVWALEHDGTSRDLEMRALGEVPERALALLKEAQVAQSAEDRDDEWAVDHIYDVTAAFGLEHVGFRHDVTLSEDEFPETWALRDLR